MAMIDSGSGWIAGWAVGKTAKAELALRCWEAAKENLAKVGQHPPQGLIVHHDQDTVYTSYRWLRQLLMVDKAVVSYCERGTKDTPWMESFWGHFKVKNSSFLEAATLEELEWVIGNQVKYAGHERRHSRLDYRSSMHYLISTGFIPERLAEKRAKSGFAPEPLGGGHGAA